MKSDIANILQYGRSLLAGSDSAALEAEMLLAYVLQVERSLFYAHPELSVSWQQRNTFKQLLQRRNNGEPVAYLTGQREFWSLPLKVTADTLIPRPETELLVEEALKRIPLETDCRIADLGTGSGAIAIAVASERPDSHIVATDISAAALEIARHNATNLDLDNIQFAEGNWWSALAIEDSGLFDIILSNPPYVAATDQHLKRGDCRFEPQLALTPGNDGLDAINEIVHSARQYLKPDGWLLLEHGYDQADAVRKLFNAAGFKAIHTARDFARHERLTAGQSRHCESS